VNVSDAPPADLVARLATAGCVAAGEEAVVLRRAAADEATLDGWVRRREQGEPLAWIVGGISFCGRPLWVLPGVYVPRVQTETLARRAAVLVPPGGRLADLCTGAGPVARHVLTARPDVQVVGTDLDERAVRCARRNRVASVRGDLGAPLRTAAFDVVTAVPPYVPTAGLARLPTDVLRYEPGLALDGGEDGLDPARRLVRSAARLLRPGGRLLLEVGGDQDDALAPVLSRVGFDDPRSWYDDDGELRGISARYAMAEATSRG